MEASLEIALFGTLLVRIDGLPMPSVRSRKVHWLLALLTLRDGSEVERDWLASVLWPDSLEKQALFNLRQTLAHLRQALGRAGERLLTPTSHTLCLDLTGATVDLTAFDAAVAQAEPAALEQAVALYRGPLLEGCLEEWCLPERRRREEVYLDALESLAEAAEGEPDRAIRLLRKVIGIDPLRECAQRRLMQALAKRGEVATAIQVYRELRLYLHQHLQTEPDPETVALFAQIREQARQRAEVSPAEASSLPSLNRLPAPLTNLIGREEELAQIHSLLSNARLVTLLGPGGVGKTRLAIAAAQKMQSDYADGVCLVDLSALNDPDLLPAAVAAALGLRQERRTDLKGALQDYLKSRRMLLVLDNCEQLIEACASLAASLLEAAPQLRILTTSRHILGLTGEVRWQTPPLPTLAPNLLIETVDRKEWTSVLREYEAVQLFLERAEQASTQFRLTPQNAADIARICAYLDGLPLAIELAAAQTRSLSVGRIRARLESGRGLPASEDRTLLPRRQTLRATLDWSYTLLTAPEKALLRRVSVFSGGWSLEAAESVCADGVIPAEAVLVLLTRLIDQSLVVYQQRGGDHGYRLLETIRQYGQERLREANEQAALRQRHQVYFQELAEEAAMHWKGPDQGLWLERLDADHDNLRAAITESLAQSDAEAGLRFCAALHPFWRIRGYLDEGRAYCRAVLELESEETSAPARAKALNGAGALAFLQGDLSAARGYFEEGLAIDRTAGDREGMATHLNNLGLVALHLGEYSAAQGCFEESLILAREVGNSVLVSKMLNNLGIISRHRGDFVEAQNYYEQGLAIQRKLGDRQGVAQILGNLGSVTYYQARYAEARRYYEESLILVQELGSPLSIAAALNNLGNVSQEEHDYATAQRYYERSLAIHQGVGERREIARSLNNLGNIALSQEVYDSAQDYFEQALSINRALGDRYGIAATLQNQGNLHRNRGDLSVARECLGECLTLLHEMRELHGIACTLESYAALAAVGMETTGTPSPSAGTNIGRSVRLWSAAQRLRDQIGAPRSPAEQKGQDRYQALIRRRLAETDWEAFWAEGQILSIEQAIDEGRQT